jgi:hypothetical protein
MPIVWAIDHAMRMVVGTAEGRLGVAEVEDYLDGMARTATLSYRKLLDLTQCSPSLSKDDVIALGARVNTYRVEDGMGPAAVVATSEEAYRQIQLFGELTSARRPLKVFRELREARQWLSATPATAATIDSEREADLPRSAPYSSSLP